MANQQVGHRDLRPSARPAGCRAPSAGRGSNTSPGRTPGPSVQVLLQVLGSGAGSTQRATRPNLGRCGEPMGTMAQPRQWPVRAVPESCGGVAGWGPWAPAPPPTSASGPSPTPTPGWRGPSSPAPTASPSAASSAGWRGSAMASHSPIGPVREAPRTSPLASARRLRRRPRRTPTLPSTSTARRRRGAVASSCRPTPPSSTPSSRPPPSASRRCAGARSFYAVVAAVGQALASVTDGDAQAFYRTAGYPA
ncbi:MAG: hypothetical protein AVDCRST_MAG19-1944 [uncultured Thermomicrobiales bacterium]|uniref:Uncharacterized protein n=1 Tax=uncultured Thermomicrobiales bacterium TaxID=1645740 RepID=A0A6J4UZL8_9BACT|nr:MAG: hypothetical protein AVDCRST_MAG19-1944 [uncultured Thermomicrobiales bacterium]